MPDTQEDLAWLIVRHAMSRLQRKLAFLGQNTIEESLHCPSSLEEAFREFVTQISEYEIAVSSVREKLAADVRWQRRANDVGTTLLRYSHLLRRLLGIDVAGKFGKRSLPLPLDCAKRLSIGGRLLLRLRTQLEAIDQ